MTPADAATVMDFFSGRLMQFVSGVDKPANTYCDMRSFAISRSTASACPDKGT